TERSIARRGEPASPSPSRSPVSRLPADWPPLERGRRVSALASRFDLADLDQLETERAHPLEHPMEGGLIEVRTAKNGLGGLEIGIQAVEARKQGIADSASDTDLVCRLLLEKKKNQNRTRPAVAHTKQSLARRRHSNDHAHHK